MLPLVVVEAEGCDDDDGNVSLGLAVEPDGTSAELVGAVGSSGVEPPSAELVGAAGSPDVEPPSGELVGAAGSSGVEPPSAELVGAAGSSGVEPPSGELVGAAGCSGLAVEPSPARVVSDLTVDVLSTCSSCSSV